MTTTTFKLTLFAMMFSLISAANVTQCAANGACTAYTFSNDAQANCTWTGACSIAEFYDKSEATCSSQGACSAAMFYDNSEATCYGNSACQGSKFYNVSRANCQNPTACQGTIFYDSSCCTGPVANGCQDASRCVVPTTEPSSTLAAEFETAPLCGSRKTKVRCSNGELLEIVSASFGRSSATDNICPWGSTTCEANEVRLASNVRANCNGRNKCTLKNRKKHRKVYGLRDSCNPYLQVQYNCVLNPFQKKKQAKKARKQAKQSGDWEAFFQLVD